MGSQRLSPLLANTVAGDAGDDPSNDAVLSRRVNENAEYRYSQPEIWRGLSAVGGSGMAAGRNSSGAHRGSGGPRAAMLALPHVPHFADSAVSNLKQIQPHFSAASGLTPWQRRAPLLATGVLMSVVLAAPAAGREIAALLLALPFMMIVVVRLAALWLLWRARPDVYAACDRASDDALPRYSVLVPLYREAAVAPALVAAMAAIDYPADRLDILFLTELDDAETRHALQRAGLAAHMTVLTVPAGSPKTKPRALNYGLMFATGSLVAVYDAEDIPDPDQLRRAVAAFASAGDEVACFQARLNIYNPGASALTRQFTLEYAALFDAILPALVGLGWPLPLSGTSNHFRRDRLVEAGAWDPYNVTEDADLGTRLARLGQRVAMLPSTTWEEAPDRMRVWLGQRTRWLKGWMQTYLVHMREPGRLWRELGPWQFFGFQILLGGMVLSALVHPWIYVMLAARFCFADAASAGAPAGSLWWVCGFNLLAGYASAMALAALATQRRGGRLLLPSALLLPLYWLATSWAAYRALFELCRRPYYWEKTPHTARPVTSASSLT